MATKSIWVVEGGNTNYVWLNPTIKKYKVVEETSTHYVVSTKAGRIYFDKSHLEPRIFLTGVSAKAFVKTVIRAETENCQARVKRLQALAQTEVKVEDVL